jgi:ATP-dependent exoDNAse (exonuclease V) beta subunit
MGKVITVKNPRGKKITFDEDEHKYSDEKGRRYNSVTSVIHSLFPEFEREKMAYFVARKRVMKAKGYPDKDSTPVPEVMAERAVVLEEWEENKNQACDLGTQIHRYAECQLQGIDFDMTFTGERQPKLAKTLDKFIPELLDSYEFLEAEKIVFCPTILLAGTIDLIMRNKKSGKLCIFDWKTNKAINQSDSYGKKGKLFLEHIENANYWYYALQLNVYRWILNREKYGDFEDVELGLFHINTRKVKAYMLPVMDWEAGQIADYTKKLKGKKK